MNWFAGKRKNSVRRSSSKTKRNSSRKKKSSVKRTSKVVFVNGKPRTAQPKPGGAGYFYARRTSAGKVQKVSVTSKTYTKTQARAKMRKSSRK